MKKKQKVWFLIFMGMFIISEILFSPMISFVSFLFGINFPPMVMSHILGEQFFYGDQNLVFIALIIEILGLLGLLFFNIKFNNKKYKILITIILFLLLVVTSFIFYFAFTIRNGIGF